MVWNAQVPVLEVLRLLDADAEPWRVFRIVKSAPPTLDDFRSAYVLGRPKARGIQLKSTAVHMALSVMQTLDQATSRAIQFPQIGAATSPNSRFTAATGSRSPRPSSPVTRAFGAQPSSWTQQ